MIYFNALQLLRRHLPLPFGWSEVVVGHDFGILSIREIQDWVRTLPTRGREAERLAFLEAPEFLRFEETLWTACREASGGRVPRPGHRHWAMAQDHWRMALLKEILAAPLDAGGFANAVEAAIDRVGSPEDMLPLVQRSFHRTGWTVSADRAKVEAFVRDLEARLAPAWPALAAS